MVGNLIKSKGYLDLIPTVKNLLKIRQDFLVQIIGTGSLESILNKQIQANQLQDYIQILGAKPNQELVKYYSETDVFFFPSKAESFGIVQIEALACGIPVVAAPNAGSQYIMNTFCGFLSPDFSPQNYANLLNKALDKKWDKEKMRNYIINNFSRKMIKEKLLAIYKFST